MPEYLKFLLVSLYINDLPEICTCSVTYKCLLMICFYIYMLKTKKQQSL